MRLQTNLFLVACGLCLTACASAPSIPATSGLPTGADEVSEVSAGGLEAAVTPGPVDGKPAQSVARAAELLALGKEVEARSMLQIILGGSPRDSAALHFMRQIETDPVKLLGPSSPDKYIVQPGDTMSGLADRFLGDSRLFYALSRYNGLAAPNALSVGRSLQIPASAKRTVTSTTAGRDTPASKAPGRKANDVRLEALQLLNKGEIDGAVELLKQAVAIDANDPAIRKDLERAERIQGSLRKG
jgi:LysM repeat protein